MNESTNACHSIKIMEKKKNANVKKQNYGYNFLSAYDNINDRNLHYTDSYAHNTATDKSTWIFPGTAYLVVTPDPVGVGQTGAIMMWVDYPLPSAAVTNDIRRINYTLTITAPDGKTEQQHWDKLSDTTGIQYYRYTPTQTGTYMLKFDYGGQYYTWNDTSAQRTYQGDYYSPATRSMNWTVQQEQIPSPLTSFPLPTEYWTHPIFGENPYWWAISSDSFETEHQ